MAPRTGWYVLSRLEPTRRKRGGFGVEREFGGIGSRSGVAILTTIAWELFRSGRDAWTPSLVLLWRPCYHKSCGNGKRPTEPYKSSRFRAARRALPHGGGRTFGVDMAKPNFDTFLDLVERSGLVGKESLDRFLAAHSAIVKARDVDALAEKLVADNVVTRWQADRLLEGRYKGFFLKKYRLLDQLGRGGMSTVYLAEHVLMQRRVAIKVLPKDRVEDTSYLARFHREAEAGSTLDGLRITLPRQLANTKPRLQRALMAVPMFWHTDV